jgi:hypothetical protein
LENAAVQSPNRKRRTNGFLRKSLRLAPNEALVVGAEGFVANSTTAQTVAAERYLLETVLRRPIVVRPLQSSTQKRVASGLRRVASSRGSLS